MSEFDDSLKRTLEAIRPRMEELILRPSPMLQWLPRPIPVPWWRKALHPRFYLTRWVLAKRQQLADWIDPDGRF